MYSLFETCLLSWLLLAVGAGASWPFLKELGELENEYLRAKASGEGDRDV